MRFPKIILLLLIGIGSGNSFASSPAPLVVNHLYNGSQTLNGYAVDSSTSTLLSHTQPGESISLTVVLPLRPGVDQFIQQVYDPKSPMYGHFLTPQQFALQFGPLSADVSAVKSFLASHNLKIKSESTAGNVIKINGYAPDIENALGVTLNHYTDTVDGSNFIAPEADPNIPNLVAGRIAGIAGLNTNTRKFKSRLHPLSSNANITPIPQLTGSGPKGYLAPADVEKAYNLNGIPSTGAGQAMALFEMDGYLPSDIATYESNYKITPVPLQNVYVDGYPPGAILNSFNSSEVTLDIETLVGFNPGASKIYVYENGTGGQAWVDEWTQIANDDLAKVVSTSWSAGPEGEATDAIPYDRAFFQQMASQGQTVVVAAGDCGAYPDLINCTNKSVLSVSEPAAEPLVLGVGISKLSTTSSGAYSSETASTQGGGGHSLYETIPSYQQSMTLTSPMVSTTMRNVPDVVLTADSSTSYSFYVAGAWVGYSGSSVSAPVWAAFISRVNQGRAALNEAPVGFINPMLYSIANSSNYANDFHNITTGINNDGVSGSPYYPAGPGYSNASGLGSFNGLNLYYDLIVPATPTGLTATSSNGQVALSWQASTGASKYNVKRSSSLGGTYTTITTTSGTSYTDVNISNGSTYYYSVSALTMAGESTNSTVVSASPTVEYTITTYAGPGGIVNPSGTINVMPGQSISVAVSPSAGYQVAQVKVDGAIVSPPPLSIPFNSVHASHTIAATFAPIVPTILSSTPLGKQPFSFSLAVSVTTNENTTCKDQVASAPPPSGASYVPPSYASLPNTFASTGSTVSTQYTSAVSAIGTYQYWYVRCQDAAGNVTPLDVIGFVVSPPAAPSVPSLNVALSATGKNNVLTWNASSAGTRIPVAYNVYRALQLTSVTKSAFSQVASTSSTTWTDPSTLTGHLYYYYVTAFVTLPTTPTSAPSNTVVKAVPPYTLSVNVGTGGSISLNGTLINAASAQFNMLPGSFQTLTITPNTGYTAQLTLDGTPTPLSSNSYTIGNVSASHVISVHFILMQSLAANGYDCTSGATCASGYCSSLGVCASNDPPKSGDPILIQQI